MVTLRINLEVKSGQEAQFEELYQRTYVPAIREQAGFRGAQLLRAYERANEYEIGIYFDTEGLRERWANSPEHGEVWPRVKEMCAEITSRGFEVLAEV